MTPFFHTALLVRDLEAAIEEFGERLQIEFTDPITAHCDNFVEGNASRILDLRVAYSRTEAPYLELVESQPSGIYSDFVGERVHHVGVWEEDCEKRVAELVRSGLEVEATQYDPEGRIIVVYLAPNGLHGLRYELVDERRRPMMEAWIAGGDFVDYV